VPDVAKLVSRIHNCTHVAASSFSFNLSTPLWGHPRDEYYRNHDLSGFRVVDFSQLSVVHKGPQ
jgi:hypothetical protein